MDMQELLFRCGIICSTFPFPFPLTHHRMIWLLLGISTHHHSFLSSTLVLDKWGAAWGRREGAEGVMETNVSTEPQLCKNRRWCHWRWRGPRDQGLIVTGKGIFQWQFKNPCTKSMYLQIGLFGRPIHPQNAQLPFLVLFCIFPCLRNVRGLWLWLVWMFLILYKINSPDWKEGELKWKTVAEIDCFDGTTAEDCSPPLT